jgi:hypothetical protein
MDTAQDQKIEEKSTLNPEPQAVVIRRESERELVTWTAPARPFKRRDKRFYTTVFAIAGIISLVMFLAEGIMPVILIVALVFLYYILSTVPPENIEYKITSKGLKVAGKPTEWPNLTRFCFGDRGGEILIFETLLIPGRIEIMIDPNIKDDLKREISVYIPYEDIPATGLDRVTDWVSKRLPGNK